MYALLALLLLLISSQAHAAGYRVVVGKTDVPDATPQMVNGQLVGQVAPIAEALGASYAYDAATRSVTLRYAGTTLSYTLGSQIGRQDGRNVWLPVTPGLHGGAPTAPLWWLGARLGAKVAYSAPSLTITPRFPRGNTAAPAVNHPLYNSTYFFPYPAGTSYQFFDDTWADPRGYNGTAFSHEGNDIFAKLGTPIVSVAAGTITRIGWNTLGGYRVTVRLDDHPDYHFYYAHFDRYAPNLWAGKKVKAGELLGYTGTTGEGPERTEGKFVPHLHFGIYGPGFKAINPYHFLRFWEVNRAALLM